MKVLFLDFDGVLNSEQSQSYFMQKENFNVPWDEKRLCPIALSNLAFIFKSCPGLRCAISSTWRHHYSIAEIETFLPKECSPIIGATPERVQNQRFSEHVIRGRQIAEFIRVWHESGKGIIEDFVILDDNDDMGDLKGHLFQTDMNHGLQRQTALDVIKRLGGNIDFFYLPYIARKEPLHV